MAILSKLIKPKIIGERHEGQIANFPPFSHMAIEEDNILIAIPLGRQEWKTRLILENAINLIKEEQCKKQQ